VTDEVKLSNDIGIFRASHMDDVHNTISVDGFIMEITMGIPKGQKTIMKTISLMNDGSYTLDCSNVKMGYSVNKKGYFRLHNLSFWVLSIRLYEDIFKCR
jgi:hypothetical protein